MSKEDSNYYRTGIGAVANEKEKIHIRTKEGSILFAASRVVQRSWLDRGLQYLQVPNKDAFAYVYPHSCHALGVERANCLCHNLESGSNEGHLARLRFGWVLFEAYLFGKDLSGSQPQRDRDSQGLFVLPRHQRAAWSIFLDQI